MVTLLLSWILGGLAFRSVGRTHEMLKPKNLLNRPPALRRPLIPRLEAIGFWVILCAALLLGWQRSGWIGLILRPFEIFVAALLLDWLIRRFPMRLQWSILLNPFVHLYVLPYCFLIFAIGVSLVG